MSDQAISSSPLAPEEIISLRQGFPFTTFRREDGKAIVYLDNAATSQKPQAVLDAIGAHYIAQNANVHRGVHYLSEAASACYEDARRRVAGYLGAKTAGEIIFTRNATEGVNLVARSFVGPRLGAGDEVLVTRMEHHSNLVPWWMVCRESGARLREAPVTETGELDLVAVENCLNERTRLVAVTHVSNVLGTVNPVGDLVKLAHSRGVPVLVDGAQSAPRLPVDVRSMQCDFFVCSGHKMLGPTGIGVLYAYEAHLAAMPPWQGGGGTIELVGFDEVTFAEPPARFEAGTPHIAGAAGLAAAIDYLEHIGLGRIEATESALTERVLDVLAQVPGVRVLGAPKNRVGVVSFVLEGVHPHDVAQVLDDWGIAVRAGHHCAQPLMRHFGVEAAVRVSPAFYNTFEEVDLLEPALMEVRRLFL